MVETIKKPAPGARAQGRTRLTQILEEAETILAGQGNAHLTMRQLAANAGISLGNLQYYFKTRKDLIRALVDRICARSEALIRARLTAQTDPVTHLAELAGALVDDLHSHNNATILRELWALAAHDPDIAAKVNEMHEEERNAVARLIARINPSLRPREYRQRATAIASMIEGAGLFVVEDRVSKRSATALRQGIVDEIVGIAKRPSNV